MMIVSHFSAASVRRSVTQVFAEGPKWNLRMGERLLHLSFLFLRVRLHLAISLPLLRCPRKGKIRLANMQTFKKPTRNLLRLHRMSHYNHKSSRLENQLLSLTARTRLQKTEPQFSDATKKQNNAGIKRCRVKCAQVTCDNLRLACKSGRRGGFKHLSSHLPPAAAAGISCLPMSSVPFDPPPTQMWLWIATRLQGANESGERERGAATTHCGALQGVHLA